MKTTLLISFLMLLCAQPMHAAVIEISGDCELSNAIIAANIDAVSGGCVAGNGADTLLVMEVGKVITVDQGSFDSIIQSGMRTAFPPINSELTIQGNGLHIIADTDQQFFRIFEFFSSSSERFTLLDTRISGANDGAGQGSALFSMGGHLTIKRSWFTNNRGAVLVLESLDCEIDQTVFEDNWNQQDGAFSPALELIGVSVVLQNSSLINNRVLISDTQVSMSHQHPGGALSITSAFSGPVEISNSTFSGNEAVTGGGVVIRDQQGFRGAGFVPVALINNTVANNTALFGGGLVIHAVNSQIELLDNLLIGNQATVEQGREFWLVDANDVLLDGNNVIASHPLTPALSLALGPSDVLAVQPMSAIVEPLKKRFNQWVHHPVAGGAAVDSGHQQCARTMDQLAQSRPADGDLDGQANCDAGAIEHHELIFAAGFE
jgi:hypothetical protein